MRIMIYDDTQHGLDKKFLSELWSIGSFLGKFDLILPVHSWEEAYEALENLNVSRIDQIQFWGHGASGAPLVNGKRLNIAKLAKALEGKITTETIFWFRACDVFSREAGKTFANEFVSKLNCIVVGHCCIISAPFPTYQSYGYALKPGQTAYWNALIGVKSNGDSKGSTPWAPHTCSIFRMNPKDDWYKNDS